MSVKLEFDKRSKLFTFFIHSIEMMKRSTRHIFRHTDQLLGTFFQPIMFLVLFAAVFGGAIEFALPEGVDYLNFLMAGIIVQTVAFGSSMTAVAVTNDLQKGIIDRFKSLPMSGLSVMSGYVTADIIRNSMSTVVMIVAGLLIGFRTGASVTDWLLIALILGLFTFSFSWLMSILGIIAKSVEGVQWLSFVIVLPITFASSAFVPTENMPSVLKAFAENQPVTQTIEAVRALMLGNPTDNHVILSIVWSLAILVISMPLAAYLFSNKKTK